jgi:ribosomal protein L40E
MERKSSLKECPKCGLRNKPGATQCDFCGQNLGTSDEWQQHIKDLESLNKIELPKPLDDRTSKRIASTIIRKDAPVTRNVGIKEAGSIGKVLKELDEPPAKDKALDAEDERPRQASVQDKLRIKEVGSVPLVERDAEETLPVSEGPTIADILKEQTKEIEVASPPAEPRDIEEVPSAEPMVEEKGEEPKKEVVDEPRPEQDTNLEPVKAEGTQPSAVVDPQQCEKTEEQIVPDAAPESPEEFVPTNEVTVEVIQPLQEQAPSAEVPGEEEKQITVSSNVSHETIKLDLVEVERPKEKLVPITIAHRTPSSTMAAIAVLALGSVAYLVVLALTAIGLLGTAAGLGGGAVSSFMIIFGAAAVYPSLRKKNDDEVYICPKCHEKVGESSDRCPACGAEFES